MNDKKNNQGTDKNYKDPYFEREAKKYDKPIPSRELILQLIQEAGKPLRRDQIAQKLGLESDEELEALRRRLRAMERDGQLVFNRRQKYCLVNNRDLITGRIIAHPDGFGFLKPDDGSDDLFMSPREMRSLMHNDRVVARIQGVDRRGRREGGLVDILERGTRQVVGRLFSEHGVMFVVSENKRMTQDVLIPPDALNGAKKGQIVVVEIVEYPTQRSQAVGKIVEILGEHMAPGMEIDVAIHNYELPHVWPEAVENETAKLSPEVAEADKQGRTDIRHLPLVTIDGEDARDFDDAVYCQKTPKGWKLLVAIADVSHYVKINTALDEEAKKRSTSVYFPEQVIPMLPEILSNGLCSLNPHVDRLCMVCEMQINEEGRVIRSRFYDAVMQSHARLTYDEVAKMLVTGNKRLQKKHAALMPHLEQLYALYKVLRTQRERRGAMDFDTQETRIIFGQDRKIEKIVPVERNDAHKLIEECMITANTTAARYLNRKKIPRLLRVHEPPTQEKIQALREFLGGLGLHLGGGDNPSPLDFMQLLESVKGRDDAHLIQTVLLRTMSQAVYSPENKGHFGLALDTYTHFTSPIRRYPDLLVHRGIRHCLQGKKPEAFFYGFPDMAVLGEHCSANERRADEATRDVESWLKCEYMQDKVGEVFTGLITAVTGFGFFVELKDIFVEGLVHISSLPQDYFHFDAPNHQLLGERTGIRFRLGDVVNVKVVQVSLDEKKIDFELVGVAKKRRSKAQTKPEKRAKHSAKKASKAKKSQKNTQSTDKKKHSRKKRR